MRAALLPEYQDTRDMGPGPHARLVIETAPAGVIRRNTLRLTVHRVVDPGPYRGKAGDVVCVLRSRRGGQYIVLVTAAGSLIVFNDGASRYTPWSRPGSPFGRIEYAPLAPFFPTLADKVKS